MTTTKEQVIICRVHTAGRDIVYAVRPDDPLNPSFTVDELEEYGFSAEIRTLHTPETLKALYVKLEDSRME